MGTMGGRYPEGGSVPAGRDTFCRVSLAWSTHSADGSAGALMDRKVMGRVALYDRLSSRETKKIDENRIGQIKHKRCKEVSKGSGGHRSVGQAGGKVTKKTTGQEDRGCSRRDC